LQGAPGVGKTYAAKRLAYSMMGVKDVERVMMVQFHQSYSYEDFIMGFRPSATGFELKSQMPIEEKVENRSISAAEFFSGAFNSQQQPKAPTMSSFSDIQIPDFLRK